MEGYSEIRKSSINQRIKFLLKDASLYGSIPAIRALLGIFLLPVMTQVFSVKEYGMVDALTVLGNLLFTVIIIGLDGAVAIFYYEKEAHEERQQIISQAFLAVVTWGLISVIAAFIFSEQIIAAYVDEPGWGYVFRFVILNTPIYALFYYFQNLLKWSYQRKQFIIVSIGSMVVSITLTIIFITTLKMGIKGVFIAQMTGNLLFAIAGFYFLRRYFVFIPSLNYLVPLLKFGVPVMALSLLAYLIPSVDRYFISNYLSLESLGVYAVLTRVAQSIQLPTGAFQMSWPPFAVSIYREPNANYTYRKVLIYHNMFTALAALLIILLTKPLILFLATEEYLSNAEAIVPLTFWLVMQSVSGITGIGIDLSKKTVYKTVSFVVSLLITIGMTAYLIKPYGLTGVAWALLIGEITRMVINHFLSSRLSDVKFPFVLPNLIFIVSFLLGSLFMHFEYPNWLMHGVVSFAVLLVFAMLLAIIHFMFMKEK